MRLLTSSRIKGTSFDSNMVTAENCASSIFIKPLNASDSRCYVVSGDSGVAIQIKLG